MNLRVLAKTLILCAALSVSWILLADAESIADSAASQPRKVYQPIPFDGVWEGSIDFDREAYLAPQSTPLEGKIFRIEIHGAVVRVFQKVNGSMEEIKPGAFHIAPVFASAVVFATDSDPDNWVETWVFVVSQKDGQTLRAEYSRLVNNVGVPRDDPQSIFGTRGTGEFWRVTQ
jgi:hypothetical protein